MPMVRLGASSLAIKPEFPPTNRDANRYVIYWDTELKGFGLKITENGHRAWIVEYRPGAGGRGVSKKRIVLGSASTLTAEKARRAAKDALANARVGDDPATARAEGRAAISVSDLADAFITDHVEAKRKDRTASTYRRLIDDFIKPKLGTARAADLTRAEVAKFHLSLRKTAVTANRAVAVLSAIYSFGDARGLVPEGTNPTKKIEKYKEESRERFLSVGEFQRLGAALRDAETRGIRWEPDPTKKTKHAPKPESRAVVVDQHAVAAIRLLLLTGARLREILHLRWPDWDKQRGLLNLPDSKTGKKSLVLNDAATAVLKDLPKLGRYVIAGESAGQKDERPRADLNRPWRAIRRRAGLEDVRLHDLRHSYAAVGAGQGLGLVQIGGLLGHSQPKTTARYAHLANAPLRAATNIIGETIAAALEGK
ncbi:MULTISPECIES: site-specific integrase [Bradyrhizobium]|jgi:integrase|uniref:site-specific integrase n=1 Tax=Bradyrhizobium TaxID=374 RepID=UPI0004BC7191|nr:site-specific integrase [Bradyrhizobium japonicum]MCP1764987.1 integrase [Bradyrhizobium japonicum]MCP1787124.1 integrase [Bradyrhizobium japonicum]MCP1809001.1 integrase [Bradyrhizobium japonicum]MCP1817931.1 integrase [Bradyrhizobium japonicum]MCP1870558.1 integrase [Bradyrhizobium japonicum]